MNEWMNEWMNEERKVEVLFGARIAIGFNNLIWIWAGHEESRWNILVVRRTAARDDGHPAVTGRSGHDPAPFRLIGNAAQRERQHVQYDAQLGGAVRHILVSLQLATLCTLRGAVVVPFQKLELGDHRRHPQLAHRGAVHHRQTAPSTSSLMGIERYLLKTKILKEKRVLLVLSLQKKKKNKQTKKRTKKKRKEKEIVEAFKWFSYFWFVLFIIIIIMIMV